MKWKKAEYNDVTRDRGVLTESDRKYLVGKSDIEPGSHGERRARERIRNRTKDALLDCRLMFEELEERDLEQIFMLGSHAQGSKEEQSEALKTSAYALAFILEGIGAYMEMEQGDVIPPSRDALENAFKSLGRKRGYLVREVNTDVQTERITDLSKDEKLKQIDLLLQNEDVDKEAIHSMIENGQSDE